MLKKLIFIMLFFAAFNSHASTPIRTTILNTGINSNGNVFVTFADNIPKPGCIGRQLVLEANNA